MDKILNVILAGGIAYILIFGFKDREPPIVKIKFPKNNYTFRANKPINVYADDNKGIKSITYYIDDEIFLIDTNKSTILRPKIDKSKLLRMLRNDKINSR